jgi:hypothetical protein
MPGPLGNPGCGLVVSHGRPPSSVPLVDSRIVISTKLYEFPLQNLWKTLHHLNLYSMVKGTLIKCIMINKQKGACGTNLSNLTSDLSELQYDGHRGPLVDQNKLDQNNSDSKQGQQRSAAPPCGKRARQAKRSPALALLMKQRDDAKPRSSHAQPRSRSHEAKLSSRCSKAAAAMRRLRGGP